MPQDDNSILPPIGNPRTYWGFKEFGIPAFIMAYPDLAPGAKLVYTALLYLSQGTQSCSYSMNYFIPIVGLGRWQIQKHLKSLEKLGLISRKHNFHDKDVFTLRLSPILRGEYPETKPCMIIQSNKKRKITLDDSTKLDLGLDDSTTLNNPTLPSPSVAPTSNLYIEFEDDPRLTLADREEREQWMWEVFLQYEKWKDAKLALSAAIRDPRTSAVPLGARAASERVEEVHHKVSEEVNGRYHDPHNI